MGFFHSEDFDQPRRASHRHGQQAIPQSQGQFQPDERLAAQWRAIPGVEQMREALEEIEIAQTQMRKAGASLRMVLNVAPLAQAYAQFKEQGGVTARDWALWLDGKIVGGARHASKQHLRIVSARMVPSLPRRPIGSAPLEELVEGETELMDAEYELADYDGDGPEAA
jgi:hypothetical protein